MSLAQQLLLRALVAWFWREPLDGKLVRWGTALHDRFMLEHFVWQDFLEVLRDLKRAGYRFDPVWFDAQREFRFPLYGAWNTAAFSLNCVMRLSPGTCWARRATLAARVDLSIPPSSALQVKCRRPERGTATSSPAMAAACRCYPTGRSGRIRCRRALQGVEDPPSALHPTIDVHAPLTFDIIDRLEPAVAGRLRLSRGASGRPQLRDLSRQFLRGGSPPSCALRGPGSYPRDYRHSSGRAIARISDHARSRTHGLNAGRSWQLILDSAPGQPDEGIEPLLGGYRPLPGIHRRDDGPRWPGAAALAAVAIDAVGAWEPKRSAAALRPQTDTCAIPACSTASMRIRPASNGPGRLAMCRC